MTPRVERYSRREFVAGLTLTGTAGLLGLDTRSAAAEPPLETTQLRLAFTPGLCTAPQFVAEELLSDEGFTEVQYLKKDGIRELEIAFASGEANIGLNFAAVSIVRLDAEDPIVILAGSHIGCFELFGTQQVRKIRDLKGRTVAVPDLRTGPITFLSAMAAHVGLDPRRDIHWVTHPRSVAMQLLADGKIDAYLGFPPDPQELRAKQVGHVVVNSATDRPWSQYFCCMIAGNRQFVQKNPVATKRALRAILKAADLCALEPERVARFMVDKGFTPNYDHALQTIKGLPYGRWREYDAEDTLRFYALRLKEVGMIKSSPQKIIAQGTDWRFLTELKKELKG